MNQPNYRLVLRDTSLIDVEEMRADVPAGELEVVQPGRDAETHNELATILLLSVTVSALTGFTLWLLRKHASETIDYKVTVRNPDGSESDVHLKIRRNSSEAPEAQVIKQIAAALKVPENVILAATK